MPVISTRQTMGWLTRCCGAWMLLALAANGALRGDDGGPDAVDSAARGLRHGTFPWYDSRQDSLRPLDVSPPARDVRNRDSQWTPASEKSTANQKSAGNAGANRTSRAVWQGLQISVWVLLAVLLVALIAVFVWAALLRDDFSRDAAPRQDDRERRADIRQLDNLPFSLAPAELDLLADARRQFDAGDYRRATILLFSHLLVQLDHHQFIRLARGKTNRQYLRDLTENIMTAFEEVFFGGRAPSRSQFEGCWNQYQESRSSWEGLAE
jgi:hypothetical protein